jgi:hypothetical protein
LAVDLLVSSAGNDGASVLSPEDHTIDVYIVPENPAEMLPRVTKRSYRYSIYLLPHAFRVQRKASGLSHFVLDGTVQSTLRPCPIWTRLDQTMVVVTFANPAECDNLQRPEIAPTRLFGIVGIFTALSHGLGWRNENGATIRDFVMYCKRARRD